MECGDCRQTALSMMVSIGSLFGILIGFNFTDKFGYRRIMFVGLVAATGFIFMLVLAPNRTVLLVGELLMGLPNGSFGVMGQNIDEAEKSLKRLTSTTIKVDIPATVAMMVHTTEMEKQFQEDTSYWDCFKGIDLHRTEISCMSLVIQSVSLGKILAFAMYFFELAGVPTSAAFSLGIGQYAIGFVAVWTA
ncbi:hypothetical protein V1508DRAFT_442686 [Lipomyces doorenjongii]|uniref:uncharacterized protein n=1 Tax=Lipomyces doorenjongii TaxID=383834 RepID=UPI0034CD159B